MDSDNKHRKPFSVMWPPSSQRTNTGMPNAQGGGFSWLLPLQDGAPPIGWADAFAYLSLPVLLVASQFVSQKLISPPQSNDPSQQSSQWILKFLPFMIGEQPHQQCYCVCTLVGSGGCCGLWWLRNLLFLLLQATLL